MRREHLKYWIGAALIIALIIGGNRLFAERTIAQEDGPVEDDFVEEEVQEIPPDCKDPGNSGHPACRGYVSAADRTATAQANARRARQTATAKRNQTATAVANNRATAVSKSATAAAKAATAEARTATAEALKQRQRERRQATQTAIAAKKTAMREAFHAVQTQIASRRATQTATAKEATPTPVGSNPVTGTRRPPTITPTPTPTPTPIPGGRGPGPVPPPGGSVSYTNAFETVIESHNRDILDVEWAIFDSDLLQVDLNLIPAARSHVNPADYEFRVKLNPRSTGFYQIQNGDVSCTPGNAGRDTSVWLQTTTLYIIAIRCGLGQLNNSGFEVWGRDAVTLHEFLVGRTGEIKQAWHQEDRKVTFGLELSTVNGSKPSWATLYNQPVAETSVREAAARINGRIGQRILGQL